MKRSAAPSVVNGSKKPRFCPPFAASCNTPMVQSDSGGRLSVMQKTLQRIRKPLTECEQKTSKGGQAIEDKPNYDVGDTNCSTSSNPTSKSEPKQASSCTTSLSSNALSTCMSKASAGRSFKPLHQSEMSNAALPTSVPQRAPGKSFQPPLKSGTNQPVGIQAPEAKSESSVQSDEKDAGGTETACKYYNIVWCKVSKKKHKRWEGDGILLIKTHTAILKDMEGKDIAKGTGYRGKELADLKEGSTLIVGGKELEVMNEITAHDWKTGKCFIGSTPDLEVSSRADVTPRLKPSSSKKFNHAQVAATPASVSPLYNPCHPNALVMPRPGSKHQMEFNRAGLPVVDVVVDPHLTVHLRPHQREGVTFLYECVSGMREIAGRGAILADEMGLGKTLQCITTIWTLIKQGPYGRKPVIKKAIIVTPGSLVKNWEREFHKWLGSERLRVFAVSTDKRVEEFVKSPIYPVLIVSYEMFLRSHETLCRVNFDLIVCDEGHRLKNGGAKTTSLLMRLTTRRRIVLTGTPIQNDLHEFYSIVEFCNPGVLGSHAAFCRVYEGPIVQSRQPTSSLEEKEIGEMRGNELNRLVSLFCLRRTQEINNKYLPPKVENVVFCQMSSLQLSLYHHLLESSMVKACVRHVSDTSPHLKCIGALKKLCNCPSLLYTAASAQLNCDTEKQQSLYDGVFSIYPDGYDPINCDVHHSGKLVVLNKMLECLHKNATEKIVLVSNYTQTLDLLQRLCKQSGYQFLRLDGSTPASNRQSLVEQFNNKHLPQSVFLLSSKAGGVGLNLTGASRLVLYDSDWNPANDLQAMARVWRDGQRKKVHIYRLLTTGSIEEKIYQRQISKQGLSMVVEGQSTSGATQFSLEELKDLFTLHDSTLCDTHDLMGCNCMGEKARGIDTSTRMSALRNEGTKRIAADELMKWRHCNSPLASSGITDELLLCVGLEVTFVFQNETNKT